MLGLSLRVSWICLLLFSSAACFPASKEDYRYPYRLSSWDSSGSAHGSNLQPDTSRRPLVSLQHEVAPQQASRSQSPSSVGAPMVVADPAGHTPPVERNAAGPAPYAGPPVGFRMTPSLPVQPLSVGGSGNSKLGSGVPAHRPAHGASRFASGSAGPAGHTATAFRMDGPVAYAASGADLGDGPVPYAAGPYSYGGPGLPWDEQPAGGADASFSDPSTWMPSRSFPDFSAWESNGEMSQGGMQQGPSGTSPLPPSSYIVQSSNGYERVREVLSHTKYSPEYPEPPVMAFRAAEAPRKSPPMTGSKGGPKV